MWVQITADHFVCSCCKIDYYTANDLGYGWRDNDYSSLRRILCEYCFPSRDDSSCQKYERDYEESQQN